MREAVGEFVCENNTALSNKRFSELQKEDAMFAK
jgi:hypothetical protein